MQLVKINGVGDNANAPTTSNTTDRRRRILQNGKPGLFLVPDANSFEIDGNGKVSGWYDLANARKFIPAGMNPPAVVTATHSGIDYRYIDYSETGGEALIDEAGADVLPESGPFSVAIVSRTPLTIAATSGLIGSLAASNYMYIFVPSTTFKTVFAASFPSPQLISASAYNDNTWHTIIVSTTGVAGTGTAARIKKDGVNDSSGATGTWALTNSANYRKVAIGGVGPAGALGDGRSDIASVIIVPYDLDAVANAALLADIQAECADAVTALNA